MRILITNDSLDQVTGTVAYVKDLAIGLMQRGHQVAVFSTLIGQTGRELRAAGVPVVCSLKKVPFVPEVIHGHHTYETMEAVHHFSGTPALYVCHDRTASHDRPPHLEAIALYVAVDENCLERIVLEEKIPPEKTAVVYNFVNLQRFLPRSPLPERPQRAVVFSNYAKNGSYLPTIQEACRRMKLPLDVIGSGVDRYSHSPEKILGNYDLVFGKAKCALEAMAVGCAMICCDFRGFGGLVTPERFDLMRRFNFGMKILNQPIEVERICESIKRYNASEAALVSRRIREEASLEQCLDRWEEIYPKVAGHRRAETVNQAELSALKTMRRKKVGKTMMSKLFSHFPIMRTSYLRVKVFFSH